jgi:hypothetical protein
VLTARSIRVQSARGQESTHNLTAALAIDKGPKHGQGHPVAMRHPAVGVDAQLLVCETRCAPSPQVCVLVSHS